jgi:hypothetical protein
MSSPKISRLSASPQVQRNSPAKSSQIAANEQKHTSSELSKWMDTKLEEWDSRKQERDVRVTHLVDSTQATGRERNKKMEQDIQKLRDEFDQKMEEAKKTDTYT